VKEATRLYHNGESTATANKSFIIIVECIVNGQTRHVKKEVGGMGHIVHINTGFSITILKKKKKTTQKISEGVM
jgi:hypothetical protein